MALDVIHSFMSVSCTVIFHIDAARFVSTESFQRIDPKEQIANQTGALHEENRSIFNNFCNRLSNISSRACFSDY